MDLERKKFVRRFVQFQARRKKKRKSRKEEDHVLLPMKREDTRMVTAKEIPKGKDPKVPVHPAIIKRDNASP